MRLFTDPWSNDNSQHSLQADRLDFIEKFLKDNQSVEVEFRQDALNQTPSATIQIERNGKGYILKLLRPNSPEDGSRFFVSRLGKILDSQNGKPLVSSPVDEYIASGSPMMAWLSDGSSQLEYPQMSNSGFPFDLFAADGVEVESKGVRYILIAERTLDGDDTALNFSINQDQGDNQLCEVRRVFISRSIFDHSERANIRNDLSEVLKKLSNSETFEEGLLRLDRMVDAGLLIGSRDHDLSLDTDLGDGVVIRVEYLPEEPIENLTFFTERDQMFKY